MFHYYLREFRVTSGIIAVNLLMFFIIQSGMLPYEWYVSIPGYLSVGTFLSHFSHTAVIHIFFNLFIFYQLGPIVEKRLGEMNYLIVVLGIWLLTVLLLLPVLDAPTIGFSGVVMGLLTFIIGITYNMPNIRNQLVMLLVLNIAIGLAPGVSFFGHFMGALSGAIMYLVYRYAI